MRRDRTCWESIPGMMKELWWRKQVWKPMWAAWRDSEEAGEVKWERKMSSGETKAFWLRLWVDEKGFWLVWVCRQQTSLHLNAPMKETRPYRAPSPSFVPNLQFPILSGWGAALNLNEEKLKILPFPIFPIYSTLSSLRCPSIFTRLMFSDLVLEEVFRLFTTVKIQTALCENTQNSCFQSFVKAKVKCMNIKASHCEVKCSMLVSVLLLYLMFLD